ncbi:sugar transferase [Fictibacillus sp. Mic-4]|uniref:sugar transferase n=1 Tax=Fictibacillus sp. Mic-4 TaxID=3132826 RepID=UPI003CF677F9
MNKIETPIQKVVIMLVDLGLLTASYFSAFYLRSEYLDDRNWESYFHVLPWILLTGLFFFSVYELNLYSRKTIWDLYRSIFISTTFIMFFAMAASFLFRAFALPRSVILLSYILSIVFLITWKIVMFKLVVRSKQGTILLVSKDMASDLGMINNELPTIKGMNIVTVDPELPLEKIYAAVPQADSIIIGANCSEKTKSKIIYHAVENDKIVYVVPSLYDLLVSKSAITSLDDTLVMGVKPFGLSWDQLVLKRLFDIVVSAVLLIFLSPLFIISAIAIKIEDPKGSIFYKQERIGRYNKAFYIYKFRSMVENAEKMTGPVLATENDDRITKVGKFLRLTRIDELPQLINVLSGSMSIVGPRPERDFFIKQFTKNNKSYQYRNTVKPGITGYAQINGKYTTDVENKLRFDLYYIRNYSFWMDIVILMKTINVVLDKSKAEGSAEKPAAKKDSMTIHS